MFNAFGDRRRKAGMGFPTPFDGGGFNPPGMGTSNRAPNGNAFSGQGRPFGGSPPAGGPSVTAAPQPQQPFAGTLPNGNAFPGNASPPPFTGTLPNGNPFPGQGGDMRSDMGGGMGGGMSGPPPFSGALPNGDTFQAAPMPAQPPQNAQPSLPGQANPRANAALAQALMRGPR